MIIILTFFDVSNTSGRYFDLNWPWYLLNALSSRRHCKIMYKTSITAESVHYEPLASWFMPYTIPILLTAEELDGGLIDNDMTAGDKIILKGLADSVQGGLYFDKPYRRLLSNCTTAIHT